MAMVGNRYPDLWSVLNVRGVLLAPNRIYPHFLHKVDLVDSYANMLIARHSSEAPPHVGFSLSLYPYLNLCKTFK